jgi:DNA-binding CsgD family transcriptional regulator
VHANAAAEALLRAGDGLSSEGSCLAAITVALTALLRRAIAQAATATGRNPTSAGSTLKLPRRAGVEHLVVTVSPLSQDREVPSIERAVVLVSVQRERRPIDLMATKLREIYGLTDAEMTLVSAMLDGGALPAVANRLSIGHTTARTHLKHIFEKTQTRRQAELLQLVHVLAR